MSDQIRIALIGAVQAIVVALIGMTAGIVVALLNRKRDQTKSNRRAGGTVNEKRLFMGSKTFIWLVAPITGAALALAGVGGWRAFAASEALRAPFCIHGYFYPSGYMNDVKQIEVTDPWKGNCHSGATCVKITYTPGSKPWAGVYWQYPDGNWGDKPGRKVERAKKLVFWARGQNGGETIDFKAGGINVPDKKYQDSFEKILDTKTLTTDWQLFEIDLEGADTNLVIGAFAWTATKNANPQGITFYLDGICYQ